MRTAAFFMAAAAVSAGVLTATLQNHTIAAWDKYVQAAEAQMAAGRALLEVDGEDPKLVDLNPNGETRDGYIHHWTGALRIPNATVAPVRAVLEDYEHYPSIYSSDVRETSASKTADGAYDLRMVTERTERLGLHFAFEIRARVTYGMRGSDATVESRSYSIRESKSAKPPFADLMPEGNDHGILWRLNAYWRLRQMGKDVYAECEVISLSRKPLIGTHGLVKSRARDSLAATLRQTRYWFTSHHKVLDNE